MDLHILHGTRSRLYLIDNYDDDNNNDADEDDENDDVDDDKDHCRSNSVNFKVRTSRLCM